MTGTIHKQVTVSVGDRSAEVDEPLAPLVQALWEADIDTYMSCQRHSISGKVWLGFTTGHDAERFLEIVVANSPARWGQVEQWYFGQYERTAQPLSSAEHALHPKDWEFHASVYVGPGEAGAPQYAVTVSVLFPRRDLTRVVAAFRLNATKVAD